MFSRFQGIRRNSYCSHPGAGWHGCRLVYTDPSHAAPAADAFGGVDRGFSVPHGNGVHGAHFNPFQPGKDVQRRQNLQGDHGHKQAGDDDHGNVFHSRSSQQVPGLGQLSAQMPQWM
ncbi:MAG: hypothetical protein KBA54_02690, partial [Candidatus Cloacimonetes bacterium]|nr:hypothetical protein [Candidatus Cloacimonadota bacterium]